MDTMAKRAHDRTYRIDPIVRSLLDTDFYKLLMLQFIWLYYSDTTVRFSLTNRSKKVRLAEIISEDELRAQLDAARELKFEENELVWLAGNKFYGRRDIFKPEFIDWLRNLKLPPYKLERTKDGQWKLTFEGNWAEVTLWEIIGIVIVNTLRNRAGLAKMSLKELDVFYSLGKAKAFDKVKQFKPFSDLNLTDFSTRRRHDYHWQLWNVELYRDMLGEGFSGTSNALIAMRLGIEAKGTNAHELPMVLAAIAYWLSRHLPDQLRGDAMRDSQYEVLRKWEELYGGSLRIFLPDTFGTTQFLQHAPDWVADWTGMRPDSKNPFIAIDEYISYLKRMKKNPKDKLVIPCDGLDVKPILAIRKKFYGKIGLGFGYGTYYGNDFRGCNPLGDENQDLDPISLVCKVEAVLMDGSWVLVVKLSDNYEKATDCPLTPFYRDVVFGSLGMENIPVSV